MTAPQHHRRRPAALLVALGLALAGLVPAAAAAPAVAAPVAAAPVVAASTTKAAATRAARPVVTVVPGDRRLSLAWTRVAGAERYVVEWSTSKKFTKKTTRRASTTGLVRTVTKLKIRTDYWVRVRAVTSTGTVTSKAVKKRVDTRAVGRVPITVKPAGTDKVRVSWKRLPRGTSITLYASWDDTTLGRSATRWAVTGIRPTATSATLTVPAKFRKYVGSTSGNDVYVRATYRNGARVSTSRAAHSRAGSPVPRGSRADAVTFASYNVGSISATAKMPAALRWEKRRSAVVGAIRHAGADVVAVQEATTRQSLDHGKRQYLEIVEGLGSGYALAYPESTVGTAKDSGTVTVTKGDHVIVRTDRVKVLASGVESMRKVIAPAQRIDKDRYFGWARLEDRRTGEAFLVASVHLQSNARATSKHRVAAINAIRSFLAKRPGASHDPIVLLGDFNSDVVRDRNGSTTTLVKAGYVDAASARTVSGHGWATTNNQTASSKGDHGYPAKPFRYAYSPTRIDYIFVKGGSVHSHTNQVVLTSKGTFDARFRGSDHNLQRAEITFGS